MRKNGIYKNCRICKAEFYVAQWNINREYCTKKCTSIGYSKSKTYLTCQECNKSFYSGHLKSKYCSRKCFIKSRKGIYPKNLIGSISKEKRIQMGINSMIKQGKNKDYTKPEKELYTVLDQMLIVYTKQKPLEKITICDAYVADTKTAIYVDGEYWHSLPKVKARDIRINNILKSKGYNVVRYTVR